MLKSLFKGILPGLWIVFCCCAGFFIGYLLSDILDNRIAQYENTKTNSLCNCCQCTKNTCINSHQHHIE